MQTQRKKLKIYVDEAKARQTSHWDLDYMTTAQIDALMAAGRQQDTETAEEPTRERRGLPDLMKRIFRLRPGNAAKPWRPLWQRVR